MPALYDRKTHNYWVLTETQGWTPYTKDMLKIHLIENGLSGQVGSAKPVKNKTGKKSPETLSELSCADQEISRITRCDQIDLQCDVAGWPAGVHVMYGKRVLVQSPPKLWIPVEGDWSFYEKVFRAVSKQHPIQYDVLMSWFKLGMTKIYTFDYRYSQILLMAGDTSSGKSLVQLFITVLVGGEMADPLEWMLGGNFNKDCIEAEHLCLEEPSVLIKDKQRYANKYKELSAKEARRCRGLYAEAISLRPFQLVSASTNTEEDNICIIPEFVKGIEDKLQALYFPSGSMPVEGHERSSMAEIKALVEKQAPAFLWHLFNEWKVPESLLKRVDHRPQDCQRFGMDPYHNPIILNMVMERSNDTVFMALFERLSARNANTPFTGTVSKLAEWLRDCTSDPDAVRLSRDTRTLGYILRSLNRRFPQKVQRVKETKMGVIWMIFPDPNPAN